MDKSIFHTNKESGFKLPDNYFEEVEDVIIAKTKLNTIKSNSFKVPDTYFETLEDTITGKVKVEKKSPKIISLISRRQLVYISSIAAAILLMFSLSIFESKQSFENLDIETVEDYVYNENISTYEIASLLSEEDLKEEDFIDYNLSDENVEDYILDHLDIQTIILE